MCEVLLAGQTQHDHHASNTDVVATVQLCSVHSSHLSFLLWLARTSKFFAGRNSCGVKPLALSTSRRACRISSWPSGAAMGHLIMSTSFKLSVCVKPAGPALCHACVCSLCCMTLAQRYSTTTKCAVPSTSDSGTRRMPDYALQQNVLTRYKAGCPHTCQSLHLPEQGVVYLACHSAQ